MRRLGRRELLELGTLGLVALPLACSDEDAPEPETGAAAAGGSTPPDGVDTRDAGRAADAGGTTAADAGGTTAADAGSATAARACDVTGTDIEGPFFTPESPERNVLVEDGLQGTRLSLSGRVLDADCEPIPNAVLDFWQADDDGAYDNEGFRLRGHTRVDADGRYSLETIVPGRYLNGATFRPAHIHVKVYVGAREALTTQIYFDGDPYNADDPWFAQARSLDWSEDDAGARSASFDFSV